MNGVNKLTNEIIGAAIEVHRTLHNGHPAPKSMSFQNNLCDLHVLGGEYVTAIRARRTRCNACRMSPRSAVSCMTYRGRATSAR